LYTNKSVFRLQIKPESMHFFHDRLLTTQPSVTLLFEKWSICHILGWDPRKFKGIWPRFLYNAPPTKFHYPMFNHSRVITVRNKHSNIQKQTKRFRWKHPPHYAMLHWRRMMSTIYCRLMFVSYALREINFIAATSAHYISTYSIFGNTGNDIIAAPLNWCSLEIDGICENVGHIAICRYQHMCDSQNCNSLKLFVFNELFSIWLRPI